MMGFGVGKSDCIFVDVGARAVWIWKNRIQVYLGEDKWFNVSVVNGELVPETPPERFVPTLAYEGDDE